MNNQTTNTPATKPEDGNGAAVVSTGGFGDFVICHVCNGAKKSPLGDWTCQCCKGRGHLTRDEHRIKTTIMLDLAKRVAERSRPLPNQ